MENKKPLIYIILPVYNWEKYLLQQLMSIYFQDYKNWYLIIVNDGSTDSTETIINKFIKNYCLEEKCTIINQTNSWVNKSVEHWLIKARDLAKKTKNNDAYITFCDSDDILMTNKLSYQINFMETHKDCDLSYHDLILIDENNAILELSFINELNKNILTNTKCDKFYEFALINHLPSNTPMFRINKMDILFPFPTIFPFHDRRTALAFSWNNYKIKRIKRALWYYRKYNNCNRTQFRFNKNSRSYNRLRTRRWRLWRRSSSYRNSRRDL